MSDASLHNNMVGMMEVLETIGTIKGIDYANILMVAVNSYNICLAVSNRLGENKDKAFVMEVLGQAYEITLVNMAIMLNANMRRKGLNDNQEEFNKQMNSLETDLTTLFKQLGFIYEAL